MRLFRTSCTFLLLGYQVVSAVPSPASLASDIEILLHNDIYGNMSSRSEAVLLLGTPQSNAAGSTSCTALGESLWTPSAAFSSNNFLKYLEYYGTSNTELFHIAGAKRSGACTAITTEGKIKGVDCTESLRVLCSQSAPYSYSNFTTLQDFADTSEKWQTTVSSGGATYTGYRDHVSFRFLGMRFAEQPERFTYSTYYNNQGDQSALQYGQYCAQSSGGGEDCLFLNVWTPYLPSTTGLPARLRPVLFWIYGGGFSSGLGSDPTFDGGNLASRGDVVVVTINYRVGPLGFLAIPGTNTTGNYALSDQVSALDWVQAHIADFGGDPTKVTIFGQSAGAQSVRLLLHNKKAQGKFAAGIGQSTPLGFANNAPISNILTVEGLYTAEVASFLNKTGCTNASPAAELECLKAFDAVTLQKQGSVNYPVIDNYYIYQHDLFFNNTGIHANVPMMFGNMRDEDAGKAQGSWIPGITNLTTQLNADGLNGSALVASGDWPLPAYTNNVSNNITLSILNVSTDAITSTEFRCDDFATAHAAATNHIFPIVYYYQFNRSYSPYYFTSPYCNAPATASHPNGDPDLEYFKCHSGDLMYVFGSFLRISEPIRDDHDVPFSQFVIDTWTSWAKTYNPNVDPRYLKLRGYSNTTLEQSLSNNQIWTPLGPSSTKIRNLQWGSKMVNWGYTKKCADLGYPKNQYLVRDG